MTIGANIKPAVGLMGRKIGSYFHPSTPTTGVLGTP